ncbi:MAG: hypothetical protein Q8R83_00575 [Legionellaceae bacterium]|nr:hypothetical protein [Legionellaceae bacterium]
MLTLDTVAIEEPKEENQVNDASNANQTLTCVEMWLDGMKAVKAGCDPLSDVVACIAGTLCCMATAAAQAEENKKTATRGDVLYAKQHRRNDAAQMGCAFAMGACIGDTLIDSVAITIGSAVGCVRASTLSIFGNNQRQNTVFGFKRESIDNVDLFSSCRPITSCCDDEPEVVNSMTMSR